MKDSAISYDLIQMIPRTQFQKLCDKWQVDKGIRSLSTWKLLQVLIFHNLLRLKSLREDQKVFLVAKSTLSDATRKRCSGFFEDLCELVGKLILEKTKASRFKIALRELLAIDSTEVKTHGSLSWLRSWSKSDGNCAVKLHVIWNVHKNWISDFRLTGFRRNDLVEAKKFQLFPNRMYVFDRAYVDLKFWLKITQAESNFVTRLKRAARMHVTQAAVLKVIMSNQCGVLWEGEWTPSETACRRLKIPTKQLKFRQIIYRDPKSLKIFHFITSDLTTNAQQIADIYKKRWSVELLFRWLKGHLDIRTLHMRTPNAVRIYLCVAVLIQLLLQLKKLSQEFSGTLSELLSELKAQWLKEIGLECVFAGLSQRKQLEFDLSTA